MENLDYQHYYTNYPQHKISKNVENISYEQSYAQYPQILRFLYTIFINKTYPNTTGFNILIHKPVDNFIQNDKNRQILTYYFNIKEALAFKSNPERFPC